MDINSEDYIDNYMIDESGEICLYTGIVVGSKEYEEMTDEEFHEILESYVAYKETVFQDKKGNLIPKVIIDESTNEIVVGTGYELNKNDLENISEENLQLVLDEIYDRLDDEEKGQYGISFTMDGEICIGTGLIIDSEEVSHMSDECFNKILKYYVANRENVETDMMGNINPTIITDENDEIFVGTNMFISQDDLDKLSDEELDKKLDPILDEIHYKICKNYTVENQE